MGEYLLMNKDTELVAFSIVEEYGTKVAKPNEILSSIKLPIGYRGIQSWIEYRNFAKHKEHLKKWLKEWNLDDIEGFIRVTHCLSLNDSFWVKPQNSNLKWDDVNLYNNQFDDVVSRTAFETGLNGLKLSSTSPEFTSEGSFEKCWIKENDGIYLYKKGSSGFSNAGLEPFSEYYAAQIASIICGDVVAYDLKKYKGTLVSCCKMFTNENEGFVPFYRFVKYRDSVSYGEILEFCSKYKCQEQFKEMIVLDSIILNHDRHLGNFGFIVDNDTMEIKRFAPVFDHNMSLLCRATDDEFINGYKKYVTEMNLGHKLGGDFLSVAKSMMTDTIYQKLRNVSKMILQPNEKYNFNKERMIALNKIIWERTTCMLHDRKKNSEY